MHKRSPFLIKTSWWLFLTGKHLCWSLFVVLNMAKFLRALILKNIWLRQLLKMCSWNWEKLKFIRSFNFTLKKSLLIFNINIRNKSKYLVFTSWLISQEVCIHIQYFFGVARNKLANTKYLELIKRRSKVQENNMSCERALNFDQWKTFSENYKPMRVWLWLVYKFTENYCRSRLFF